MTTNSTQNLGETMKIVINTCFGGFGLSYAAVMMYAELKGIKLYPEVDDICKKVYGEKATLDNPSSMVHYYKVPPEQYKECSEKWCKEDGDCGRINSMDWYFSKKDIPRGDPDLIKVVKKLGKKANGRCAELSIVEVPDGIEWKIDEYDGNESIDEKHRTWR